MTNNFDKNKEYLYHQVPNESVRQTVERNYYKYVAPQNTPRPNISTQIKQLKQKMNTYLTPQEVKTSSNWGQQTAQQLDRYMQNYNQYPGTVNTGVVAPFYDMWRNYKDLRKSGLVGADNFFHCKANYEASKRGALGKAVSRVVSAGREAYGILSRDPLADVRKDWHANSRGWTGAKQGLSLQEACPTNPKAYVNPDDYDDIY